MSAADLSFRRDKATGDQRRGEDKDRLSMTQIQARRPRSRAARCMTTGAACLALLVAGCTTRPERDGDGLRFPFQPRYQAAH